MSIHDILMTKHPFHDRTDTDEFVKKYIKNKPVEKYTRLDTNDIDFLKNIGYYKKVIKDAYATNYLLVGCGVEKIQKIEILAAYKTFLGNYLIVIPDYYHLKQKFPSSLIRQSIRIIHRIKRKANKDNSYKQCSIVTAYGYRTGNITLGQYGNVDYRII